MQDELISRRAVKDKLLKFCNELEAIFANIRMENQDESVCGLCEYDCTAPYECPGFDDEDCFKLADEIRHKWQSTKDLPSVNSAEKQELCEDAISRQAAIDALKQAYWNKDMQNAKNDPCIVDAMTDWAIRTIKDLPSVNPQQKTGHWIDIMVGDMQAQACDQCKTFYPLAYTGGGHRFCPNCGCRMVEPQESEVNE